MQATSSRRYRYIILFIYFLTINILFCLPGNAFPKEDWLDKIWFDKWVHIGFFALLMILVSWAFDIISTRHLFILFMAAIIYGLLIEVVQDQFITNRSFDTGDWLADGVGACLGISLWRYIKK